MNFQDAQNAEYFMKMAYLCGLRSKDNRTQVGACIVNELGNIIAMGYNGFPYGCSDDIFPWTKFKSTDDHVEEKKHLCGCPGVCQAEPKSMQDQSEKDKLLYVVHAEANAITEAIANAGTANLKDCVMYATLHPCHECAKKILKCGIAKVYYLSGKNKSQEGVKAAVEMLGEKVEKFKFSANGKFEIFKSDSKSDDPTRTPFLENTNKRSDYLSLKDFYMAIALLSSEKSTTTDAITKTGACIVRPPFHVVSIGYKEENKEEMLKTTRERDLYVCHSPVSAITNRNCGSIEDCEIYTTHFPCNECVKVIIQSKIKKIYYMTKINEEMADAEKCLYSAAYKMLKSAGVSFERCNIHQDVTIDFNIV